MILAGEHEDCLREVLIIAAALEVQDPRETPTPTSRRRPTIAMPRSSTRRPIFSAT